MIESKKGSVPPFTLSVRHRAAGAALRAAHQRAVRTYRREVIADSAAAAHGFRGFHQRYIDAGLAVDHFGYRIAHRLHKAVDQRRAQLRAGRRVDAPPGDEPALEHFEKQRLPIAGIGFHGGERTRHAAAHILDRGLATFGVLLEQHVDADLLWRKQKIGVVGFHELKFMGFDFLNDTRDKAPGGVPNGRRSGELRGGQRCLSASAAPKVRQFSAILNVVVSHVPGLLCYRCPWPLRHP